jgi:hypothetical protein
MLDEHVYRVNKLNRDGTRGIYFGYKAPIDIPGRQRFYFIGPWSRTREDAIRSIESVMHYVDSNSFRFTLCDINEIKEALKHHVETVRDPDVRRSGTGGSIASEEPLVTDDVPRSKGMGNDPLKMLRWTEPDRSDESMDLTQIETPFSEESKRARTVISNTTSLEEARIKLAEKFLDTFASLLLP